MIEQRSQEWFKQRQHKITASSVGAIMDLAPYTTRKQVMKRMVREYHGLKDTFVGNVATEYGNFNESGAVVEFEMETGLTVDEAPFVIHPSDERFGASPDGYVSDGSLLEIKCPYGLKDGGEFKSLDDQSHYYAQVQFQMFCTGYKKAYFYQWAPHKTNLEEVEYDEGFLFVMLDSLNIFWDEYLVERELPNAKKYLDAEMSKNTESSLKYMIDEYIEIKYQISELQEKQKELLNGMTTLTDEQSAEVGDNKLIRVDKKGSISYSKVVKELLPEADLEQYRGSPSVSRMVK